MEDRLDSTVGQSTRLTNSYDHHASHAQPGTPVSPPVYRQSTLTFETVAELDAVKGSVFTYGRHGNPTTRQIERILCELEGAAGAMLTPSGLSAITTAISAVLRPGDHILVADSVYSSTREFCDRTLGRWGVEVTYYAPTIGAQIGALMRPNTRLVVAESPGSITFEMQDIPALAQIAHSHGALLMIDNTWGTPLHFASFAHGVDISVHSASKYIGGHADLCMGVILASEPVYGKIRACYRELGLAVGADDAALALRGLRTLSARLACHQKGAINVASWLYGRPEVADVLHPALPTFAGHEIWRRDFTGACGLFGVLLRDTYDAAAVVSMVNRLSLFGLGYSWGGFESLVLPCDPRETRTATTWTHEGMLVRLHIGLENVDDLMDDLDRALRTLTHKTTA
ncbi:cystathionine beta-lyase [Pandoraea sp. ISTKB]|uniref:cystathionine beta-lyase n=1 Tax=Pandoraea sp. ISTKB TaxID=1586708 RepID=UPI0009F43804|nr:cystathionine beta-lyase [Pandoraea sp. ISTKB]